MVNIYDVDTIRLIEKTSEELKKVNEIKAPEWAKFVKTGHFKQRPPISRDWWYFRIASLLRKIYVHGPVGVNKLKRDYGGKKRRGYKPPHFYRGSGSIIRKGLQQLEKAGFIKQVEVKGHKGRAITPAGKSFLDKLANQIKNARTTK